MRQLLAHQFPQWTDRSLSLVTSPGTSHTLIRLGSDLVLRFPRTESAVRDIERITAGAHELTELGLIDELRRVTLPRIDQAALIRLLGGDGTAPGDRLGLGPAPSPTDVRARANEELQRWRSEAENPLATPDVAYVAQAASRTCEGLIAAGL